MCWQTTFLSLGLWDRKGGINQMSSKSCVSCSYQRHSLSPARGARLPQAAGWEQVEVRPPVRPHGGTENAELVLQMLLENSHVWCFGAVFPPKKVGLGLDDSEYDIY